MTGDTHNPVQASPAYLRLTELQAEAASLAAQLAADEFALPEIRDAYGQALQVANDDVAIAASSEVLQDGFADEAAVAVNGLAQLEPLRGRLPEAQLAALESTLLAKLGSAAAFFERYGARSERAEEVLAYASSKLVPTQAEITYNDPPAEAEVDSKPQPEPAPAATAPTAEAGDIPKTPVLLVLGDKALQVGHRGHIVPYSSRQRDSQRDYSRERRAAVEYMIDNQDRPVKPQELWEAIGGEVDNLDHTEKKQIILWLASITFRRQPIFEHNGKRGSGSEYGVSPAFALTKRVLHTHTITVKQPDTLSPPTPDIASGTPQAVSLLPVDLLPPASTPAPAIAAATEASVSSEDVPEGVQLSDLYLLAFKFFNMAPVLKGHGLPTLDEELFEKLKQYRPDLSQLNDAQRVARREQSLKRVRSVIEDDGQLLDLFEELESGSPAEDFLNYLLELREHDQTLMARLVNCWDRPSSRGGKMYVDQQGQMLWPPVKSVAVPAIAEPANTVKTSDAIVEAPDDTSTTSANELDDTQQIVFPDAATMAIEPVAAGVPVPEAAETEAVGELEERRSTNTKKRELVDAMAAEMASIVVSFAAAFPPKSIQKLRPIQAIFHNLTPQRMASARDNGVISRESRLTDLGLEEILRVMIYTHPKYQSVYAQKSNQKIIERKIKEAIAAGELSAAQ